jgi:hypothetical protein
MYPNVDLSWRTIFGGGKLMMTAIFAGSTSKPYLHTIWPNSISNGVPNMHFFIFSDI